MLHTSTLIQGGLALALSIVPALADQASTTAAQTPQRIDNELHAAINDVERHSVVDINDRFVVKSDAADDLTRVAFGVLDGMRAQYGTCGNGNDPELGDRHTTWVEIAYSDVGSDGLRDITVRRTLDFHGNERVYRFRSSGDGEIARLEPGISVEFEDGVATYVQTTGPIGMSGETDAIRLTYQFSDRYDVVATSVELDQDMWTIMANAETGADVPIYSINNATIVPHSVAYPRSADSPPIIAAPMVGPGIPSDGGLPVLKVSNQSLEPRLISDVETTDEDTQRVPCPSIDCLIDLQCLSFGPSCRCVPLSTGLTICLV